MRYLWIVAAAGVLAGCKGKHGAAPVQPGPNRIGEATRLLERAQAAHRAGDKDRAFALVQESLAASQDLYAAWNEYGLLLMERERYIDAVPAFQRASEIETSDPRPLENIGLVYDLTDHEEKALEYYLQALERDPRSVSGLRGAIRANKILSGATEGALERVRTALMLDRNEKWLPLYQAELTRIDGILNDPQQRRRN